MNVLGSPNLEWRPQRPGGAEVAGISRVVVVGPASPAAVSSHLDGPDRERAAALTGLGGVPVNSLVTALVERGMTVQLVTLTPECAGLERLSGPNLEVLVGPYRPRARARAKDLYAAERRALWELLSATTGEVVHAHWTYEFALPCERLRRPVVVTAHDAPLTILRYLHDKYRLARTLLTYRVRAGIRLLTAVSPYLAQRWRREMAYRRPIAVVPNIATGLPTVERLPAAGRRVVLDVSDSGKRKNIGSLCKAFNEVRRSREDAVLRLVGPGLHENGPVAQWARARSLDTGVEFVGRVSHTEISGELARADVLAHVALEEAHPLSVCEAMSAGTPVVAGIRSGGVPWTLDAGRCGHLVDVRDPRAIAAGILSVLADPAEARRLAEAARERAATTFGPTAVVDGYLEVYRNAMQSQSFGPRD